MRVLRKGGFTRRHCGLSVALLSPRVSTAVGDGSFDPVLILILNPSGETLPNGRVSSDIQLGGNIIWDGCLKEVMTKLFSFNI